MAEAIDIRELNVRIEQQSTFVTNLTTGMDRVIVGQKHLVDSLLISLLSDGHILLEGVPGLAKTLAIKTLSQLIDAKYSRIQFTPDLLPADVVGTMIYSQKEEAFQVEDGTLEDDQNRRDFSINAMAVCLNGDRFGELVDPFDGVADLEDGIIATPLDPDITFSDDPLRMMRCIRFATQLNFVIEEETFEALERNKERINIISNERIADELNKIMLSPTPSIGFIELERCGILPIIFPELSNLMIVDTINGRSHKNNFYHTLEVLIHRRRFAVSFLPVLRCGLRLFFAGFHT